MGRSAARRFNRKVWHIAKSLYSGRSKELLPFFWLLTDDLTGIVSPDEIEIPLGPEQRFQSMVTALNAIYAPLAIKIGEAMFDPEEYQAPPKTSPLTTTFVTTTNVRALSKESEIYSNGREPISLFWNPPIPKLTNETRSLSKIASQAEAEGVVQTHENTLRK